ncbi:hypothetical protein EDB85DRAFT_1877652 [Lactarius pseudohatsudake]|nr:hypothetical protein EDB85DRAFT_1879687 [Lactarius pseudohatsudake]KAH9012552.1 hypothetical protein EDB85DRAFT_1877652 [Lactarius pseudohatsudake]
MLYRSHPAVQLYRQAYELTSAMPRDQQCQISLHFDPSCDRCRYQAPDASVKEIAVILPGDGDHPTGAQDIILYRKHGAPLQRISDCHPFYPSDSLLALCHPLSHWPAWLVSQHSLSAYTRGCTI